ncbi:MAG: acyl-CoA thioesterase [Candidatus Coatesbacteria bacterium]|nr:MAG: acyl-CoA thioesterase [Candidatus Coatesbacteria bacterium]
MFDWQKGGLRSSGWTLIAREYLINNIIMANEVGRVWQYEDDGRRVVAYTFRPLYEQTDKMGVVYYANYLLFFEAGRVEYMRYSGMSYRKLEDSYKLAMPVIEAYCRYESPALYDDLLEIHTTMEKVGRTKIKFNYRIVRDDKLLAEGYTIHPVVDANGRVVKIPEVIEDLIS